MSRWPKASLEEACSFLNGGTPSTKKPDYFTGHIPWITSADITDCNITPARSYITKEAIAESATNKVPPGTVLLVTRTGVGKVAVAQTELCFSQDITAIVPARGLIDTRYLVHFLRTKEAYFKENARGATIKGVTREVLDSVHIPLPSLAEQRRIAAILDKADAIRRKRRAAIDLTGQFLRSVFLDMFGDPQTNRRGWPGRRLIECVRMGDKINYGVVQPGPHMPNGVPIVRVGDFENMRIRKEGLKRIAPVIEAKYARSRLVGDEVLVACVGSIGRVALAEHSLKGCNIVRAVARIPLEASTDRWFLAAQLQTPFVQDYFVRETRTVSQPTLNIKQIEQTPIVHPPLELQRNFADAVSKARKLSATHSTARKATDSLFESLVQRAFRGELRTADSELAEQEGQDEEPVSVLLERIRAEREAQAAKPKTRRPREPKQARPRPTARNQEPSRAHRADEGKAKGAEQEQLPLFDRADTGVEAVHDRRSLDDFTKDEIMAAFRQACRGRGEMDRGELLREVATRLGYRRLGKSIRETLKGHLRAAIRRKIVGADGDTVWPEARTMDDYTRDELVETIRSVTRKGQNYDREGVIEAVASHLGFARVRETVREPVKSAINAAIRRGVLEREGPGLCRSG